MSSQLDPAVGRDDPRSRPKIRQPQRREFHAFLASRGGFFAPHQGPRLRCCAFLAGCIRGARPFVVDGERE
jgi:hypothetical protein